MRKRIKMIKSRRFVLRTCRTARRDTLMARSLTGVVILAAVVLIAGCARDRAGTLTVRQPELKPEDPQELVVEMRVPGGNLQEATVPTDYGTWIEGASVRESKHHGVQGLGVFLEYRAALKTGDFTFSVVVNEYVGDSRVRDSFRIAGMSGGALVISVPVNINAGREKFERELRSTMAEQSEHFKPGQEYEWEVSLFAGAEFDNLSMESCLRDYPNAILFEAKSEPVPVMDWRASLSVDGQRLVPGQSK
jgi:hypothetical protein